MLEIVRVIQHTVSASPFISNLADTLPCRPDSTTELATYIEVIK